MSGVEIIGFVLGGLPLVISAAEHYKKGFEPLLRWKRFKFVFRDFITSVDIQKQMFQLVLKKLLIRVQLEPEEKQKLLTTPNYEGWCRDDIVEALRSRLGESYEACMDILKAMKRDILELQAMMSLKDGSVDWANPGEKKWKYQAKRIQLSFSENGTRTVQSLEKKIQDLKALLDLLDSTNDTLDGMKAVSKDTTWGELFKCIRRHAISLHSAISNGWRCNCEVTHLAGLQLQKRATNDWSSRFTLTFALPEGEQRLPNPRRKVLISTKDWKNHLAPVSEKLQPAHVQDSYLNHLRTNFESKSQPEVNTTTIPIRPGPHSSSSSVSSGFSFGSMFTKSDSVVTASSISVQSGTEALMENESKKWGSTRKSKPKRTARFVTVLPSELENTNDRNLPVDSSDQQSCANTLLLEKNSPALNVKIVDLCSTLRAPDSNAECLGYLSDDENEQHEVRWIKDDALAPRSSESISLEELLTNGGHLRLSRQKRYRVASVLASSLLQLQTTPWLTEKLEKKNILFHRQGSEVLIESPYINHSFSSTNSDLQPSQEVMNDPHGTPPRKVLSSLGILLLELCFGQSIESQTELRKSHLSPDGKALDGTDYLTAIEWLDMVGEEEPKMAPIIKWCIFCLFEGKPNWKDTMFMQAVYASVVHPLEMLVAPT